VARAFERTGRLAYAAGVAGLGIFVVMTHDLGTVFQPVADWLPAPSAISVASGLVMLIGGLALIAQQTRPIADLPTSPTKPTEMAIMVWDENKEHLVHLYMPFWLLRFGHNHIDLGNGDRRFDFDRLNISIADLERVGPVLLIDARGSSGERVLIWTQ